MIMEKKCINCLENRNCQNDKISWLFFTIGLIATISIRTVIVLMHLPIIEVIKTLKKIT